MPKASKTKETKQEVALTESTKLTKIGQFTKTDVKEYICPGATDKEIVMFLNVANMFKLNPLKKEIYLVKYGNNPAQMLTGYEVYLKRAERSKKWDGFEVKTAGSTQGGDLRAICTVWRKDWTHPLIHEAYFDEYAQYKKDGTLNKFWRTKPRTMIKKVAISQGFRLAFPDELGGIPYTEFDFDAKDVIDVKGEDIDMPTEKAVSEPQKVQNKKKPVEEAEDAQIVEPEASEGQEQGSEEAIKPTDQMIVISDEQVSQIKEISETNGYIYKEIVQIIGMLGYSKVKSILDQDFEDILASLTKPAKVWRKEQADKDKEQKKQAEWGE